MFKKGDVINAIPPKEYGEWSCLMFTEDAKPVHGNPLKYMGKARPVCQAYQDEPELGRNLFCHSCRHQCPQREYMVKYVGRFEPQEAQPQTAAKMVEKTTKHSGAEGETHNGDLETLMSQRKTKKQVYDGSTVTEKKKTSSTESKKAERDLQREQTLLQQQAEVNIVSPFLMQTTTSGEAICGKVPVFFVVLELVEGQELGEYIAAIHNLSDRSDTSWRCLDLIRQLLLAIRAYAKPYNNRYYVHRDLKPSNMMVKIEWENGMPFQQLKIIDFDMLVAQNHIREDNVYLGGTPGYVHPEAYRLKNLPKDTKRQFSHQWDLYAAGLIIYEIMEGHPYFKDDSYLSDPEKAFVLDMGLLSARYIVSAVEQPDDTYISTFTNDNGQEMYYYENERALPIGFAYDTYMTKSQFEQIDPQLRAMVMLTTLVVDDADVEQVSSCLNEYTYEEYGGISLDRLDKVLDARRKESSESFTQGKNYFISEIHASGDRYAFFSVPYDECWRATVNGESREVININGLMAVRIDAGDNTIRFDYVYTPLKQGIACSIAGVLLFAGYMIYFNKKKKRAVRQAAQSYEE